MYVAWQIAFDLPFENNDEIGIRLLTRESGLFRVPADLRWVRAVRRDAHRLGYRFRLNDPDMPGRPHIVFPKQRAVLFVCSCYEMAHVCQGSFPWTEKRGLTQFQRYARRRLDAICEVLPRRGWRAGVIWACELELGPIERCLVRIVEGHD